MVNQACHEACLSRVRRAGEAEGSLPTSSCLPVVSGLPAVAGHSYENCRVYTNNSHSGSPRAVAAKGTRSPQRAAIRSGSSAVGNALLAVFPLASNRHFVTSLHRCFPEPVDFQPLAGHNFSSASSPTVAPITEEGE